MERKSFVMFKNWADAINALPEDYQLEAYKALMQYGITGIIPQDISAISNAILIGFSGAMDSAINRYNANVENGKKGGRPKNLEKPNKTQQNPQKPNHNLNDNVNDNVNDIYKKERVKEKGDGEVNSPTPLAKKKDKKAEYIELVQASSLSTKVQEQVIEWLEYKKWKYTEVGLKSLLTTVAKNVNSYGESAVCAVIVESMGNMWQGICWDKLGRKETVREEKEEANYTVDGDYLIFKNGQRVHRGTYEGWKAASKGN